jgi:hypothetical protein
MKGNEIAGTFNKNERNEKCTENSEWGVSKEETDWNSYA